MNSQLFTINYLQFLFTQISCLYLYNLEEEEVAIIEKIAEVLERRQKDKLPTIRDIPKKKMLQETAKVDKVLCKFKI